VAVLPLQTFSLSNLARKETKTKFLLTKFFFLFQQMYCSQIFLFRQFDIHILTSSQTLHFNALIGLGEKNAESFKCKLWVSSGLSKQCIWLVTQRYLCR